MPLYEYLCDACGHRFEVIQKFSDARRDTCPECGGPVHKMQSAPAFQLKGTGWYLTDYAKSGQSGADKAGADKKESGKDTGTSEASSTTEGASQSAGDTKDSGKADSKTTSASDKTPTKTPTKTKDAKT